MFAPLYILANFFWAAVLFIAAIALAVVIGWKLSWKQRWMLIAGSLLVGIAVGFCMMGQYWLDVGRAQVRSREFQTVVRDSVENPRLDEICRTAMIRIPAVSAHLADGRAAVLDVVSYQIGTGRDAPRSQFGRMPLGLEPVREVTLVYAVGPRTGDPRASKPEAGAGAPEEAPERLYFRLEPDPWRLVRVYTKRLEGGALREVPVWDEAIDRQRQGD